MGISLGNYQKNNAIFSPFILFVSFVFFSCQEPEKKIEPEKKKENIKTVTPVNAPKSRTLTVKPPVKNNKKKIYLTFDDGPNKGTPNVMSVVREENVPATFFIVGQHVFGSKEQHDTWDSLLTMQQVALCNHSYTHAWQNHFQKFFNHPDSVVKDFIRTQDSLHFKNRIVRAPGRNCWRMDNVNFTDIKKSKRAIDALEKNGFIVIGWDLEWHFDSLAFRMKYKADKVLYQIDSVFKKGKTKTPNNLVLLAHDQLFESESGLAELKKLIQKLKQNEDYELLLVTDYPNIKKAVADSLKK